MYTVYKTQTEYFSLMNDSDAVENINDTVKCICDDILKRLPLGGELKASSSSKHPLALILKREVKRFNGLLELIRRSLSDMRRTINGLAIADEHFNETLVEIANNKVPSIWIQRSYLTMKPLSSYIDDLSKRIDFFQAWCRVGAPNALWFSAFYFPQALITTIKQCFCKHSSKDFDDTDIMFEVVSFETSTDIEFDTFIKVE